MKYFFVFMGLLLGAPAHADFFRDTRPFSVLGLGVDGFEIVRSLSNKNRLAKLGVRVGDIVLAADYRRIINMQSAREAYDSPDLRAVTLIRNHKKITLSKKI